MLEDLRSLSNKGSIGRTARSKIAPSQWFLLDRSRAWRPMVTSNHVITVKTLNSIVDGLTIHSRRACVRLQWYYHARGRDETSVAKGTFQRVAHMCPGWHVLRRKGVNTNCHFLVVERNSPCCNCSGFEKRAHMARSKDVRRRWGAG